MSEDRGPAPELGGASDTYEVERASATPLAPAFPVGRDSSAAESTAPGTRAAPADASPAAEVMREPLASQLVWFAAAVMDAVPESFSVEQVLTAGPKLSAQGRLHLYQYSYRARLIECLADDYPAVKYAAGEERFEELAGKYIEVHPSRAPSLNYYGKHFSALMTALGEPFFADLSRLEWAMIEVLHAAPSPVLSMAHLQEMPPEAWAGVRFRPAPSLRFHTFDYPANSFLRAQRTGQEPAVPGPAWSATAIYRKQYTIWRMDFTQPMAEVMSRLLAHEPLGDALSTLPEALAGDVMVWFREWVSGGFFESVD